jgi:hypothetical protein
LPTIHVTSPVHWDPACTNSIISDDPNWSAHLDPPVVNPAPHVWSDRGEYLLRTGPEVDPHPLMNPLPTPVAVASTAVTDHPEEFFDADDGTLPAGLPPPLQAFR